MSGNAFKIDGLVKSKLFIASKVSVIPPLYSLRRWTVRKTVKNSHFITKQKWWLKLAPGFPTTRSLSLPKHTRTKEFHFTLTLPWQDQSTIILLLRTSAYVTLQR